MKTKSTSAAYLLWLPPLGLLGAHRFYLGQRWAVARMCLIVSVASLLTVLRFLIDSGWLSTVADTWAISLAGAMLLWWIADGYLTRGIVKIHNTKLCEGSSDKPSTPQQVKANRSIENKKSMRTAYLLWLPPLGWLGVHRFYARRWSGVRLFVIATIWSVGTWWFNQAWNSAEGLEYIAVGTAWLSAIVLTPLTLWWLIDGFLTGEMVERHNAKLFANSGNEPSQSRDWWR